MTGARSAEELDQIETRYYRVSGFGPTEVAFLGARYNELRGFETGFSESWVCDLTDGADGPSPRFHRASTAMATGVWRSPTGRCFVSVRLGPGFSGGTVLANRDIATVLSPTRWSETVLPDAGALGGIWGISDDCVYTWGTWRGGRTTLHRFDGTEWFAMTEPGFIVSDLHGTAPDNLVAVGIEGQLAWFDGGSWTRFARPTDEYLHGVFVVGRDQAFAVGNRGSVLEGSLYGWGKVAQSPPMPHGLGIPLHAVTVWRDELWLAGGVAGLFKRIEKSEELECVDPAATALSLDGRGDLVAGCFYRILTSHDGTTFTAAADFSLHAHREGRYLTEW